MSPQLHVYAGAAAVEELVSFAQSKGLARFTLVGDERTQAALGSTVQTRLEASGFAVRTVVLPGPEVVADERALVQVFLRADQDCEAYLAVGAGTITDIVRFVGHRAHRPFISLPTAPSVDGFTSTGAPLVIDGFKQTIPAAPPIAIFAHLPTLCAAPRAMIAAGFGDMLGKYTAAADWRLGAMLWREPYDEAAAARTAKSVEQCIKYFEQICDASPEGIAVLTDGLIESGLSMSDVGHSRPASGAEHHISHYWEMKLLTQGRPAILHGAKVGVASVVVAGIYQDLRRIGRAEAKERLARAELPGRSDEEAALTAGFGRAAAGVAADHHAFLDMTGSQFEDLRTGVLSNWEAIQTIAAQVPEPGLLADMLERSGGPAYVEDLGFSQEDVGQALAYSHYLRNRFTILKLARMLGMLPAAGQR